MLDKQEVLLNLARESQTVWWRYYGLLPGAPPQL